MFWSYKGEGEIMFPAFNGLKKIKLELNIHYDGCELMGYIDNTNYCFSDSINLKKYNYAVELKNITLQQYHINCYGKEEVSKDYFANTKLLKNIFINSIKELKEDKLFLFKFTSKTGILNFSFSKPFNRVFYRNYLLKRHDGFILEENNVTLDNHKKYISIFNDTINLNETFLNNFQLSLELLQGQKLQKILLQNNSILTIYLNKTKLEKTINELLENYDYLNESIVKIIEFLNNLPAKEYTKWKRALNILIMGRKTSYVDFIVTRFQFLDIFKDKGEKFKVGVSNLLNLSDTEALFLTKIRNDIVHDAEDLKEIIDKYYDRLIETDPLRMLLESGDSSDQKALLLYLEIDRLIDAYISSKIKLDTNKLKDYNHIMEQIKNTPILINY